VKLHAVHERDAALKRYRAKQERKISGFLVWDPLLRCYYTPSRPLDEVEKIPMPDPTTNAGDT
jgi:hypothetical protein